MEKVTTTKTRTYGWAVVNPENFVPRRDTTGRRAFYKTRREAREAARRLGGSVRRRTWAWD